MSSSSLIPLLALLIATGVASMETSSLPPSHKVSIDTSSLSLPLEARSEAIESTKTPESSTKIPKIYPVYPEYRTNTEKPLKPSTNRISVQPSSKDSYLDALEYSHTKKPQRDSVGHLEKSKTPKLIRRTYEGPVYRPSSEYGALNSISAPAKTARIAYGGQTADSFLPTPSSSYSLPVQHAMKFGDQNAYGNGVYSPQSHYGAPSSYGPPQSSYGPPQTSYGPPHNVHVAHAQSQQGWSGYALPELPQLPSLPNIDFAWPLAIKFNAFTIAKILLKLVIFKMIVKFIAIICLLLFIPKLEMKSDKDDMDDEGRKLIVDDSMVERMNLLTAVVHEAIEHYGRDNGSVDDAEECMSVSCRIRRFLESGDSWSDYAKILNNYVAEESRKDEDENTIDS